MSIIKGEGITLKYPDATDFALQDVSFVINKGRFNMFIGRSGSGKTTLLKCIANLIENYEGAIECQGKSIRTMNTARRVSLIGFVSQQFNLFPHMTILGNCVHPQTHVLKRRQNDAKETSESLLEMLGISHLKNSYPNKLSGGQQQRVAIARALAMNSRILLLDEPTSALDPESTAQLQDLLHKLRDQGITLVISSHDMTFVKGTMDLVYFMEKGIITEKFDLKKEKLPKGSQTYNFINGV